MIWIMLNSLSLSFKQDDEYPTKKWELENFFLHQRAWMFVVLVIVIIIKSVSKQGYMVVKLS